MKDMIQKGFTGFYDKLQMPGWHHNHLRGSVPFLETLIESADGRGEVQQRQDQQQRQRGQPSGEETNQRKPPPRRIQMCRKGLIEAKATHQQIRPFRIINKGEATDWCKTRVLPLRAQREYLQGGHQARRSWRS